MTINMNDAATAELIRIGQLGLNTDEGWEAAVTYGRNLMGSYKRVAFLLGDLAVLVAPGNLGKGIVPADTVVAEDRKRLRELAEAMDVEVKFLQDMRLVALAIPPAHRMPGVPWTVYKIIHTTRPDGMSPVEWVAAFTKEHKRPPRRRDVDKVLGKADSNALTHVRRADDVTRSAIVTEAIRESDAARKAALDALHDVPSLSVKSALEALASGHPNTDTATSSHVLAISAEVTEVDKALEKIIPILARALDNVDKIAASSTSSVIADRAARVSRMATRLADTLTLDPSKVMATNQ